MGRGVRLALLGTAVLEIVAFVLVGRVLGFGWAVLLVMAASAAGLLLLRREGMLAWRGFRAAAEAGRPPGDQVIDGLVGLLAGGLLALPGLVSGAAGVLLAVPPVRRLTRRRIQIAAERRVSAAVAGDLFGPRQVRVFRGDPQAAAPDAEAAPATVVPQVVDGPTGPAIEGEIVGPRRG